MSAPSRDRTPDPANPAKLKPAPLDSKAYVLSQTRPDGPWMIVDRSGSSRLVKPEARPGVDGVEPMDAMRASAERRQEVGERLNPDGHVLFVAASLAELAEYRIRP